MSKGKFFCGIALALVTMAYAGASLMLNQYPSKTALVLAGVAVILTVAIQLRRSAVRRRKMTRYVSVRAQVQQPAAVIIDRDLMIDTNPARNSDPTARIDHFKYDPIARELVSR